MKFSKISATAMSELQLNAGILLSDFTPATGEYEDTDILGATNGGCKFAAVPKYKDFGDSIDNCPKNTKEYKRIDSWDITMGGTFVTVKTALAKQLLAAADIGTTDTTQVKPRNNLTTADFSDIWWVGDYSDKNGATHGGYIAIKMSNALSTGGFQVQSANLDKGAFPFTYTAHVSAAALDTVPCEIYIKAGTAEA